MSTRTDWGWFDKDDKPLAVGDEHAKWQCPRGQWKADGFEHPYTGEWVVEPDRWVPACKLKDGGPKRDRCTVCGNVFIYP